MVLLTRDAGSARRHGAILMHTTSVEGRQSRRPYPRAHATTRAKVAGKETTAGAHDYYRFWTEV